jgi:hypothetical protein
MTLERGTKIDFSLVQGIEQWESAHGSKYMNKDGSINKKGEKERNYLRRHNSSWNDLKWDNFMFFHLNMRTPVRWKNMIKDSNYYRSGDVASYFETQQLLKKIREDAVYISQTKECKQCKGQGVDWNMPTPRGKCPSCKGKGRIKIEV